MPHTGLGAYQGVTGNAQSLGDGVGSLEPYPVDVEGQSVRVLLYPLDRLVTIGLVDAHRSGGADAVGLEEDHDLPDDLLLRPCPGHPFFALGSDTFQFEKSLGFLLDHVEHLVPVVDVVIYLFMPLLLFTSLVRDPATWGQAGRMLGWYVLLVVIMWVIATLAGRLLRWPRPDRGALSLIFIGARPSEIGEDAIAQKLGYMAAIGDHRRRHGILIAR